MNGEGAPKSGRRTRRQIAFRPAGHLVIPESEAAEWESVGGWAGGSRAHRCLSLWEEARLKL
jgi:hypothetical protein